MIQKHHVSYFLGLCFLFPSLAFSAQLYRYTDSNGIVTLSKTLPADAAQKGYDIIDDRTMRLLEHVPAALTEAELAEQAIQQAAEKRAAEAAEKIAKTEAAQRRQQYIHDRNLLSLYHSERELLNARSQELQQWQSRMAILTENQAILEARLQSLQNSAAQRELSGTTISDNLRQSLSTAEKELATTLSMQTELQVEIDRISDQYERDRLRLLELLSQKTP